METTVEKLFSNIDLNDTMRRWTRLSNDAILTSIRLGQPVMEAYLKSLSGAAEEMGRTYRTSCDIPQTDCPPYCVCELEWDAYEGDTVTGTIDVTNTGKDPSQFSLSASEFTSEQSLTSVKPELSPASFALKPGESKRIAVTVRLNDSLDPDRNYSSEVKIAGRYEQCVRLAIRVRRKMHPSCRLEHGEIPRRIVAHNWYDHFQCEELCFEPVEHREAAKQTTTNRNTQSKRG